jgi:DNA-binding response OmpR family regulator
MAETTRREPGSEVDSARAARIGSARADFIANLGRRIAELRSCLSGLAKDPGSPRLRDDLRRRVHALSAGARLLRFSGMASALADAEQTLERAASVGGLTQLEIQNLAQLVDNLSSLAWGEPSADPKPVDRPPPSSPLGESGPLAPSAVVVGPSGLADALAGDSPEVSIEIERTDNVSAALDLVRALAPDVVVVDADLDGASDLVETLARDALMEPMPIVVVGTWQTPEQAGRWVALGSARALPKPVSPSALRRECGELIKSRARPIAYVPLGEVTVDTLAVRIAEEVRRGLCESAASQSRSTRVPLGDGAEVLAAVWSAVARVREIVTIKSEGAVRFSANGPEGALPIAPWWGHAGGAVDRPGGGGRGEETTRLDGRRVIVVDDDPAVTWFLGGVLRAAGARVNEVHDGQRALDLCYRISPDLVISDVLMPGLDGFALCRAMKRDIAVRDVPVILLSWKEDLLQRLRELGADADGYMRKEASSAAVLQRVAEVLRPRSRIEARLKGDSEVRGRLDGVTPCTLLDMIRKVRPNARLSLRDAAFLYEVEMRDGAPRSATRTASDGSFQRGPEVLAALLGIRAGRFAVVHADAPAKGILTGDLAAQLRGPIARARAALRLLGGTKLLEAHRVDIGMDRVDAYMRATLDSVQVLIRRLADGASPREMILGGEVASAQLEAVLGDLAAHGAIAAVRGAGDVDLLGPAVENELLFGKRIATASTPPHPLAGTPGLSVAAHSASPRPASSPVSGPAETGTAEPEAQSAPTVEISELDADEEPVVPLVQAVPRTGRPSVDAAVIERVPSRFAASGDETRNDVASGEKTPSSLEAAVIRELSFETPKQAIEIDSHADNVATIVDASVLRARAPVTDLLVSDAHGASPSLPPDAVVPASESDEHAKARDSLPYHPDAIVPGRAISSPVPGPFRSNRPSGNAPAENRPSGNAPADQGGGPVAADRPPGPDEDAGRVSALDRNTILWVVGLLAAGAAAVTAINLRRPAEPESARVAGDAKAVSAVAAQTATPAGEDLPLPKGATVDDGKGLLDVESSGGETVFIDGAERGKGPSLRIALTPGMHEVRLQGHGEEKTRFVLIRASRRTRLPL